MSTGISISSINRIKELAEEKKFAEALEILDTQNLDKSINPQFLRISGEIFRENKRYYDCRRILLKAHQMAPQGNRIIYELIRMYLELGYFTKAQKYYEQYLFYSGPDDSQKDFVEYSIKKALGSNVKELASILIPILERMPEDKWNFEAVLLYDKLDRKDKALEECRYILENYKDSVFVSPVIDYIDDKLDVDEYFYIYPKEEQEEDRELFGDLIEQEEKLLEADHLRMYPPEARIMVEAEDKDAIEPRPAKEKKPKKQKKPKKLKSKDESKEAEEIVASEGDNTSDIKEEKSESDKSTTLETKTSLETEETKKSDPEKRNNDSAEKHAASEVKNDALDDKSADSEEILIKQEREAALEKLLSKKIDTEKIKESAKQMAKAVKEIDTEKTKQQVKSVAESVKDNVKKATDVIGEAVGTKWTTDSTEQDGESHAGDEEQIVDGIIESVLEPPKKVVGQVVMNEELDALIPDSLEAMSEEEIADIEARKEEAERLELEALEAALQLEEQKKSKGRHKKGTDETAISNSNGDAAKESEAAKEDVAKDDVTKDDVVKAETAKDSDAVSDDRIEELKYDLNDGSTYIELKEKYLSELEDEQPLDSLGFISVVHSDVDMTMDEQIPDTAEMLHQMIDNKEFYSGENSIGFESRASYDNHGFEVEDYDFDAYRELNAQEDVIPHDSLADSDIQEDSLSVRDIYAQEQVVDFEEIVPDERQVSHSEEVLEEILSEPEEVTVSEETASDIEEVTVSEETASGIEEVTVSEETASDIEEVTVSEETASDIEDVIVLEDMDSGLDETNSDKDDTELLSEMPIVDDFGAQEENHRISRRDELRVSILLTDKMVKMLMDLKESR